MNLESDFQGDVLEFWQSVLNNRGVWHPVGICRGRDGWAPGKNTLSLLAQAVSVPCASWPRGSLMVASAWKWLISRASWIQTWKRKMGEIALKFCSDTSIESPWPSLSKIKCMAQNTQRWTEPADLEPCSCFPGSASQRRSTWLGGLLGWWGRGTMWKREVVGPRDWRRMKTLDW